jgi:8-hydroxy-5-deazaflavin:NADPH oxidoreductase
MRIAIIGAGNVGRALAEAFTMAGHSVVIAARDQSHAEKAAVEVKATPAASNREAAMNAEMVVLAVPAMAVPAVLNDIEGVIDDKVVVDPTNPASEDRETILRESASLAEAAAILAPEARIVKAFNTLFASRMADPMVEGIPLDGFYAGDDPAAKGVVAGLLEQMGFRPVDVGDLVVARTLELMAYLNTSLNMQNGWSWRSGWKLLGPTDGDILTDGESLLE